MAAADDNLFAGIRPSTEDFSIDVPDTTPDDSDEKRKKSISRSKGWKEWREYAMQRRELYQQFLPGGNPAVKKSDDNWIVADCIIKEIDNLVQYMEGLNG